MIVEVLKLERKEVLKLLARLWKKGKVRSWFASYLAIFILLHQVALLIDNDGKRVREQGLSVCMNTAQKNPSVR